MRILAVVLLVMTCSVANAQSWKLLKEVNWATFMRVHNLPNTYVLQPFARNGRLTWYQRKDHLEYNLRAPNFFGGGCQTTYTPFGPESPCDPHTHRFTVVSLENPAVTLPGIDPYADKKMKVRWVISTDAPPAQPLVLVPIQFQYWHITNYRIMGCPPVSLDASQGWRTIECVIHLPTSEGTKVGPGGEYTSAGLDFSVPRDIILRVKSTEFYIQQ